MAVRHDEQSLKTDLPVPQLVRALARLFGAAGIPSPQADAEWLLAGILNSKRSDLYLEHERSLTAQQQALLRSHLARRLSREPLQYILGECEFFGLVFKVSPGVLISRPETEMLVAKVLELVDPGEPCRIIDLGTGSGCIAITLAQKLQNASIVATDISPHALQLARSNALAILGEERIEFHLADMCEPSNPGGSFYDIVVSNPPYVLLDERDELQSEIRDYEPAEALFVSGDGLKYYRCILEFCRKHLRPGGWVACEMASQRSEAIETLFREVGFFDVQVIRDFAGFDRHLIGQRV